MAILINAFRISKSFSARALFNNLTFSIESGERIGLIGPNGAGKSTLFKILASRISADTGAVSFQKGLRVGFLEQVPQFGPGARILSSILDEDEGHDWETVARARELISKFDLASLDARGEECPVETLSGGWKKRVALARELLKKPDLLLLDEPTNHLDVESILWLENLISEAAFATVTITHDRVFLQKVSNRILELDPRHEGGLLSVKGDYSDYLEVRSQMIASQERREVVLRNTLRRETEWLRQGAKARTTKQQARISRAEDLAGSVDELRLRNLSRLSQIDFQGTEKNPKKLLEAKGISKSYGSQKIFSGLDLLLTPGSRLGLLGRNGSGKSTLIRVLLGMESPESGVITRSEHLQVAYFDQSRETLRDDVSVAKTLCPVGDWVDYRGSKVHIKSYLDRFLFTYGQMDMAVGKLSGGEQSRLLIARLMLTRANLLVLDEPTNDLDLATLGVLEECLTEFNGAVILVTHDRYFLDQVANRILAFDSSHLLPFASVSQWEGWYCERQAPKAKERAAIESSPKSRVPPGSGMLPKKRKLSFKEQYELEHIESKILAAEERLALLNAEVEKPGTGSNPSELARVTRELAEAHDEVDRLYQRWAELERQ